MRRDPISLGSDRLLLCEGKSTILVLGPLGRRHEIQGFQPLDFGSKDNFENFLRDVVLLPGFATQVHTIGVVRDAETDAKAAFASVRNALLTLDLPAPDAPGQIAKGNKRVGVFIMPDNMEPGMIETLCMQSVDADPAFVCIDQFFKCLDEHMPNGPSNRDKARAQAFLATRRDVDYHIGRAADRGVWNLDHEAFVPLVDFLRELAN
jgi:hypothetical protein